MFDMSGTKRVEKRIKKSLLIYKDNGSFDLLGVSANISRNGLFIESPYTVASDSEISLALAIDNELFKVKAEVRWTKGPEDKFPPHIPVGMGVRLTEVPAEYMNYVEYAKYQIQY
jgi:hypothetical protein